MYSPVIVIEPDNSYRFIDPKEYDHIVEFKEYQDYQKIEKVIKREIRSENSFGSRGPYSNEETVYVIYYSGNDSEPKNNLGTAFAGHACCSCGLDEHDDIHGAIAFKKLINGKLVNFNESDIKFLFNEQKRREEYHVKKEQEKSKSLIQKFLVYLRPHNFLKYQ